MPQKHIKTWMSTDENLVARNQETAEANGLAAAHTRGRNLLRDSSYRTSRNDTGPVINTAYLGRETRDVRKSCPLPYD